MSNVDLELSNLFSLKEKVGIVIGASGALGSAIARGLAHYGADLALIGRDEEKLETVRNSVSSLKRKALKIRADVTIQTEVDDLVALVLKEFGRIDILVNVQGINIRKLIEELSLKEWQEVIDSNLKSVFLCCKAVGKIMVGQKSGKIVSFSSTAGKVAYDKGYTAYSPSKAGVEALTRVLASEWGKYNINVNAIAPYFIRSRLTEQVLQDRNFYDWAMTGLPMKRIGTPMDLVGATILLSSRASDWINGQTICIDGGRSVT